MTALVALRIDSSAPLIRGRYDAPGIGQCKTPAAAHAMKQRHAEPLLERLDLVAHRSLRDVQRIGRTREAQVTRSRLEYDQGIERWQSRRHGRNSRRAECRLMLQTIADSAARPRRRATPDAEESDSNEDRRRARHRRLPRPRLRHRQECTPTRGVYGLGDATLNGRELAVRSGTSSEHVIPCLIGRDPRNIEDVWQYLYRGAYWPRGPGTK